jgi:hypothetical protein
MELLRFYLLGAGAAVVLGIIVALLLRSGLSAFLTALFPDAPVRRFWSRIIYAVIMLSSISGAMAGTYPAEAKTDRLVLFWSLMNQVEGMGFRLLWTLLVVLSVLLLAYTLRKKER